MEMNFTRVNDDPPQEQDAAFMKPEPAHGFTILAVNTGSTSTKMAVYRDRTPIVELTVERGLLCTIRESKGIDISAACGQLREKVKQENGIIVPKPKALRKKLLNTESMQDSKNFIDTQLPTQNRQGKNISSNVSRETLHIDSKTQYSQNKAQSHKKTKDVFVQKGFSNED